MNEYSMISCPVFSSYGNHSQDSSSLLCTSFCAGHKVIVFPVFQINVLVAPLDYN